MKNNLSLKMTTRNLVYWRRGRMQAKVALFNNEWPYESAVFFAPIMCSLFAVGRHFQTVLVLRFICKSMSTCYVENVHSTRFSFSDPSSRLVVHNRKSPSFHYHMLHLCLLTKLLLFMELTCDFSASMSIYWVYLPFLSSLRAKG